MKARKYFTSGPQFGRIRTLKFKYSKNYINNKAKVYIFSDLKKQVISGNLIESGADRRGIIYFMIKDSLGTMTTSSTSTLAVLPDYLKRQSSKIPGSKRE